MTYNPTTTERLPPNAEKALEDYFYSKLEARERLIAEWLKLSDADWRMTKDKLQEWSAGGNGEMDLYRRAVEEIDYQRDEGSHHGA